MLKRSAVHFSKSKTVHDKDGNAKFGSLGNSHWIELVGNAFPNGEFAEPSLVFGSTEQKNRIERVKASLKYFHGRTDHFARISVIANEDKALEHALLIGVGQPKEFQLEHFRRLGARLWKQIRSDKNGVYYVDMDDFMGLKGLTREDLESWSKALLEGYYLAHYEFRRHKGKKPKVSEVKGTPKQGAPTESSLPTLVLVSKTASFEKKGITWLSDVLIRVESIDLLRDWSNEPSNYGTPVYYADEAVRIAKDVGLKIKVLDWDQVKKERMGLFVGVGQGSDREGRMLVLEHLPKGAISCLSASNAKTSGKTAGKKSKLTALVGKGVTFDSGGISLKPGASMEDMRHDMTGAATVMATMVSAARTKSKKHIVGILAFCENMPSGNAVQPGNVLTARSGKTVEVINTDAEGRLILADALDYAQDLNPDVLIDVATLTGAATISLGKDACAILGNNQTLIDDLRKASEKVGERIWQLPLFEEYSDDMKSEIADLRNSCGNANGGTIRGAAFLKAFIRPETKWAHLDIAAVAYHIGFLPYVPSHGASGLIGRTLMEYIEG